MRIDPLPMFTDVAPFDNNDLRLALKYAIHREEWLKVILKNYGELGNDFPIGPANQFRATADEIPQRAYDPEKAKHHLKKAGYDSIDLKLHVSDTAFEGAVDASSLYSERAKVAGINIEVVREPKDGYWSNVWMQVRFRTILDTRPPAHPVIECLRGPAGLPPFGRALPHPAAHPSRR